MVVRFSTRVAAFLHLSIFMVSVGLGWHQADGVLAPGAVDGIWREAAAIAGQNARAVCVLAAASLTTGGLGGLLFFAVNGYVFGEMLGMVPATKIYWVLLYAPVEIGAFTVASVAAARPAWMVAQWLREDNSGPLAPPRWAAVVVIVAGSLAAAALLEVLAIQGAWGRG